MDDKTTVIEDWAPPNPIPRTFMANLLNEEFGSKPFYDLPAENGSDKALFAFEKQQMSMTTKEECSEEDIIIFSNNISLESSLFDSQKSSSRGGLAQRMARSGFNAPTINTARIKSANMASSYADVRLPYLTIPPGLSPTTLLDSPVFLTNSMVQPSPTTGKLSFLCNSSNPVSISTSDSSVPDKNKDDHHEDVASGGFAFKPPLNTSSSYHSSLENKGSAVDHQQSLQSTDISFQNHLFLPAGVSESSERKESAVGSTMCPGPTDSFISNEHSPPPEDQRDGEEDIKGEFSSTAVAAPAEDGYNWRKYGQKQVKGSEFPRSYYKCTHPNCPVKKKVERSHEGHITEIIYKGAHNHAKPLSNHRLGMPSSHPFNDARMDGLEHPGSQPNFNGKPLLWTGNGMDTTSSASIATEFGNPSASLQTREGSYFGSPEAIDVSSTVSNEEDQATHGSVSLGGDGEEDESESKRRKLDACFVEMNTGSRAVREPRVVVQTTSEVDILDDGYRWRKYGQKVVKGNPNPRSYYKCTSPGCNVRKHVERASHNLKSVITTYESKHNHDVPAARNNSHSSTGPSAAAAAAASTAHRRPEPTQDGLMWFEGPAPLTNFSLPVRDQPLGLGSGFSFGMGQGLANLGIAGLGPIGQVKIPVLGPFHPYMRQQVSNTGAKFMIPKGEPKEEPVSETGLLVSNGMAAYHQLLSRLPLGPQL